MELPNDQSYERDDESHAEADDEVRSEPVLFLPFIERDLQRAHRDHQQTYADVVDAIKIVPVGFLVRRIFDQPVGEEQRQDAYWNVDVENPVPGVVVRDPAAERGSDRRRQYGNQAVEGKGEAAFRGLKRVGHDGLRHRLQSPPPTP